MVLDSLQALFFVIKLHVAIAGLFLYAALLGYGVSAACRYRSRWEMAALSTVLGLWILATIVLCLGLAGMLCGRSLILALTVPGIAALWGRRTTIRRSASSLLRVHISRLQWLLLAALLVALWPLVKLAVYPVLEWDVMSFHLATAQAYLRAHAVFYWPYFRFPVFPLMNQMLYVLGLFLSDDQSVQLIQFGMMMTTACVMMAWACRFYNWRVGVLALACVAINPVFIHLGTTGYVDMAATLFTVLSIYALECGAKDHERTYYLWSGLAAGLAMSTKYSGIVILLYGIVRIALTKDSARGRHILLFALTALLVISPWLARNYYYTGNPIFPLLIGRFGDTIWNGADGALQLQELTAHGTARTITNFLRLPYHLFCNPGVSYQAAFPFSRLTPLLFTVTAIAGWGRRERPTTAFVLCFAAVWFWSAQVLRYLVPILPLVSLVSMAILDRGLSRTATYNRIANRAWLKAALAAMVVAAASWSALQVTRTKEPFAWNPVMRHKVDLAHFPELAAIDHMNQKYGNRYCIYFLGNAHLRMFAEGTIIGDTFGPARSLDLLHTMTNQDLFCEFLASHRADFVGFPKRVPREFLKSVRLLAESGERMPVEYEDMWTRIYRITPTQDHPPARMLPSSQSGSARKCDHLTSALEVRCSEFGVPQASPAAGLNRSSARGPATPTLPCGG